MTSKENSKNSNGNGQVSAEEILTQFMSELEKSSADVRRIRRAWARKFLSMAPTDFSRWNKNLVTEYERKIVSEKKYAPGTVRYAIGVVKRVFDAAKRAHEAHRNKLIAEVNPDDRAAVARILQAMQMPGPVWDLGARGMPQVKSSDQNRPRLELWEVEKIVAAAKRGKLSPVQTAFTALASIYAYRAGELRRIRKEHLDLSGNPPTLYVLTEKGGEQRRQLITPEIVPYLKAYDFDCEYSEFSISKMFKLICVTANVENRHRMGWHAFRRSAVTEIQNSLASIPDLRRDAQLITKIFYRWKLTASSEMTIRYYTEEPLKADAYVLQFHPVVEMWRD